MNYLWETFKITFYLVLVIGFILAIYYLIKNRFNLTNSKQMEIIDTMRLANGEVIYLVKVFEEIVMLGGSKEELNYLRSWPIDQLDLDFKDIKKEKERKADFKKKLKSILAGDEKSNSSDRDV
jgi:flagellar protein FliO/FliZ